MSSEKQQPSKSVWQKSKSGSKTGFDKLWGYADKLAGPVNRLSNKLGSEAFWPTTLDKESEKAARILKSFCKDGFYKDELQKFQDGPDAKQRVLAKIPPEVIKNAKGLAIFTTMRTGLWISGAGGSGILVARKEDGSWSGPCGIMLHTAGLGFLIGVDIYDCVLVLNTQSAVDAFSKWRATIGGEISAVAGPVGVGGMIESEVHKRQSPIFTYLKSRGFYAGVQVDGTVLVERVDENERFYGSKVSAKDILAGRTQSRQYELEMLMETLKAAEGDSSANMAMIPTEPPPADYEVVESGHTFGVPGREDPDPYGVLALQREGFVIKEAGTNIRASGEEFEFNPKITSPVFRKSFESSRAGSVRSSWRGSVWSTANGERQYTTSDTSTQTNGDDLPPPPTPRTRTPPSIDLMMKRAPPPSLPPRNIETKAKTSPPGSVRGLGIADLSSSPPKEEDDQRYPSRDVTPVASPTNATSDTPNVKDIEHEVENTKAAAEQIQLSDNEHKDDDDESDDEFDDARDINVEEPVIHSIQQAAAPQAIFKPRVVTVAKRLAPKVPERNPGRARATQANAETQSVDSRTTAGESDASLDSPSTNTSRAASPVKPAGLSKVAQETHTDDAPMPGGFPDAEPASVILQANKHDNEEESSKASVEENTKTLDRVETDLEDEVKVNAVTSDSVPTKADEDATTAALTVNHLNSTGDGDLSHEKRMSHLDEQRDSFDEDGLSDVEIATATTKTAVAQQNKTPAPRISMADIRRGMHSDDEEDEFASSDVVGHAGVVA